MNPVEELNDGEDYLPTPSPKTDFKYLAHMQNITGVYLKVCCRM